MDVNEKVKEQYRDGKLDIIEIGDGFNVVEFEGKKYKVQGEKRLRVTEVMERKVRKPKEKLPETLEKICDNCGSVYRVSKFNQYLSTCPDCRGTRKKRDLGPIPCDKCGKMFTQNKFAPKVTVCSDCREIEKQERKVMAKYDKVQAKALEIADGEEDLLVSMQNFARDRIGAGGNVQTPMLEKFAREYRIKRDKAQAELEASYKGVEA